METPEELVVSFSLYFSLRGLLTYYKKKTNIELYFNLNYCSHQGT